MSELETNVVDLANEVKRLLDVEEKLGKDMVAVQLHNDKLRAEAERLKAEVERLKLQVKSLRGSWAQVDGELCS